MPNIAKAYAINDAKILFVSLVDKAANKKNFLITKSENGKADFQTNGRILKADGETHQVTGVVYEPMVEDTQGNYMTEAEIEKAAHWFMKNQGSVDLQHSFEPLEGAHVVESYVAKCDEEIGGATIRKGTWVMTMEIEDQDIFDAIEKGDLTGFSMGGTGVYSTEDVELPETDGSLEKSSRGKGILKQLASLFGMDAVEKGAVRDQFTRRIREENFRTAFYTLSGYLFDSYNNETGRWEPQTDEAIINEALQDFVDIAHELLGVNGAIAKAMNAEPVEKAGKAISTKNLETLRNIHESLGGFLSNFEETEDEDVTKAEVESIVNEAITKAMTAQNGAQTAPDAQGEGNPNGVVEKAAQGGNGATEGITAEAIQKMVDAAVEKATQPVEKQLNTAEEINAAIQEAVAKAMEPVLKSTGLPTNLNGNEGGVEKNDEVHYLHGIL